MTQTQETDSISVKNLTGILEPLIRRIVREELTRLLKTDVFQLTPDMPLYEDMKEISGRKAQDHIKLHSHEEVWSE